MGRSTAILTLPLLFFFGCTSASKQRESLRTTGLELLLRIDASFANEDGLYAGELTAGRPSSTAHCWPASVQLSAISSAAQVDPFWRTRLDSYIGALDLHWSNAAPVSGYDASARPRTPDRYYDDNAWMALALIDAHWVTRDPEHLRRAEEAMRFVTSGEDQTLGGGVWWHEQSRKSKNSCSTAPAIVACLRLHQTTGREEYLAVARRLYDWINRTLQDGDGLYFDHIKLDGTIDRTKFSYNSGVMIIANCEMFDVTREPKYLDEARRIAAAGVKFWVVPGSGAIRDDAAFAALFAEALLQLYRRDGDHRWYDIALAALRFVRDHNTDPNGWHPQKWDAEPREPIGTPRLIDQSAAVRAFLQAEIVR